MIEKGLKVPKGGLFTQNERIDYDPEEPLPAFLKLVQTLGEWKRVAGRQLSVNLLPDKLAQLLRQYRESASCEYRFVKDGNPDAPWRATKISPGVGGTFAYLRGADGASLIGVRVTLPGGKVWISDHSRQWTHIKLEETGD